MSERSDCQRVEAAAPELALGVLPGDERAAAFAHLDGCQACRANVAELGALVDEIVACGPTAEPPVGFEQRVLGRMPEEPAKATARRRKRRPLEAAGLAVAAAVVWLIAAVDGGPGIQTAEAAMRTAAGAVVGEVVVSGDGDAATLTVAVPDWVEQVMQYDGASRQYTVNVGLVDGDDVVVPVELATGGTWEIPVASAFDSVASVALVDETGRQWCYADLVTT